MINHSDEVEEEQAVVSPASQDNGHNNNNNNNNNNNESVSSAGLMGLNTMVASKLSPKSEYGGQEQHYKPDMMLSNSFASNPYMTDESDFDVTSMASSSSEAMPNVSQPQYYYSNYSQQQQQQQWYNHSGHMAQNMYHVPMQHYHYGHHTGYMYGNMMYPMGNGGAGVAAAAAATTAALTAATPSPTTNSDDSGGDCVTESKQRMMAAQAQAHAQAQQAGHAPGAVGVAGGMGGGGGGGGAPTGLTGGVTPLGHSHVGHAHVGHPQVSGTFHPGAYGGRGVPLVQKRPRQTRRGKKKRDPNEPQKPVSAYALFFRDMQAGIKARNPNASFGEVSKHVASMWDNLNPDHKAEYKKRTENAKKEYLKQLAAYRANLVSKNNGINTNDPYSPYGALFKSNMYEAGHSHHHALGHAHHQVGAGSGVGGGVGGGGGGGGYLVGLRGGSSHVSPGGGSPRGGDCVERSTSAAFMHMGPNRSPTGAPGGHPGPPGGGQGCRRTGCENTVIDFSMDGFCSNECVLSQSRDVYHSWSTSNHVHSNLAPCR